MMEDMPHDLPWQVKLAISWAIKLKQPDHFILARLFYENHHAVGADLTDQVLHSRIF